MGEVQVAITMLCLAALILLVIMSLCRFMGLWTWTATWIFSSKEEKMNLTRSKGHYNANGYFVASDSMGDINLCYSGSFKRFDPVDHDYKIAVTTLSTTQPQETSGPVYPASPQGERYPNYPQDISLPYGTVQSNDLSEFTKPSCYVNTQQQQQQPYVIGSLPKFSSQPMLTATTAGYISSSASFGGTVPMNIPPQPLRPAPAPPPSPTVSEKINSQDELKYRLPPPKRPPPPIPPRSNVPKPGDHHHHPPLRSQASLETEEALNQVQGLKRAVSCESVCSDTSVVLGDLEEPHVTGYLCVGLDYDSDCADLSVSVLEAKDLIGPDPDNQTPMDTYVRVYLLPDKTTNIQTRVYKKSNSPSYKEKFLFGLEPSEFSKRSLTFYVYASDKMSNTLIGEADLRLCDISSKQGVTTWVTLTDTGQNRTEWGELMLSLSYLPTAERLTVVVVKARNLVFPRHRDSGDPFVKVYLLKQGKKIHKKKTSTKKGERSPIFNEAMIFNVPAVSLQISPSLQQNYYIKEYRLSRIPNNKVAFDQIKDCSSKYPTVHCPDFEHPIQIQCDASNLGIGCILVQNIDDQEKVVAYTSRSQNKAERNLSMTEKECLAVIHAIKTFRPYIGGSYFTMARHLNKPTGRLATWIGRLSQCDFDIIHRKGKFMTVANAFFSSSVQCGRSGLTALELPKLPDFNTTTDKYYLDLADKITKWPEDIGKFKGGIPPFNNKTIQLRLTVAENTGEPRAYALGHVILGSQASGKALSHWTQMLSSLRKPIAMWHSLRK